MAVASVEVCSLPNRFSLATALDVVVLLTALSLLTAGLVFVVMSDFIVTSGLEGESLDLGASVNLVDLDAGVDGDFFAVIVFLFLRVCD